MRVAALYDIHGNLPALEAVLADVRHVGADTIVVGGDVASGPMPRDTLELLLSLSEPVRFVRGNADRVLDFHGYGPIEEDAVWVGAGTGSPPSSARSTSASWSACPWTRCSRGFASATALRGATWRRSRA